LDHRLQGKPNTAIIPAAAPPPAYIDRNCRYDHQDPLFKSNSKPTRPSTNVKVAGPLSWLRTNRQIFTEAQHIAYSNLTLHICDSLVRSGFLCRPPATTLKSATIRSLSFCQKLKIESDLHDGFSIARGVSHGAHSWGNEFKGGACMCAWCYALSNIEEASIGQFPAMRELRLRMYFMCKRGQGNERPVVGQLADGRPRKGQLYRPKASTPLVWVGHSARIKELVDLLCKEMPLHIFSGRQIGSIDVQFYTESIENGAKNQCPHPRDRC